MTCNARKGETSRSVCERQVEGEDKGGVNTMEGRFRGNKIGSKDRREHCYSGRGGRGTKGGRARTAARIDLRSGDVVSSHRGSIYVHTRLWVK